MEKNDREWEGTCPFDHDLPINTWTAQIPSSPSSPIAQNITASAIASAQPGQPHQPQSQQLNQAPNNLNGHGTLRTISSSTTKIPQSILDTLPTFYHNKDHSTHYVVKVRTSLDNWLKYDLDFSRLNDIHNDLWMCGRPLNGRALHRHILYDRKIFVTEQADLHLLTDSDVIMIKPLPAYILCKEVWEECLNKDQALHEAACGMLMSYIWLVRSPLDFKIAMDPDKPLLPLGLTWLDWKQIVDQSLKKINADTLQQVNKRFQFGELRLGRINSIYSLRPRLLPKHFIRGYLYGYNRYAPFLQRNFAWVLATSVLFSLVLSAMQVGTGLDSLKNNNAFLRASFGFVIFACVLVVAIIAFVLLVFGFIFFYNMRAASTQSSRVQAQRRNRHRNPA